MQPTAGMALRVNRVIRQEQARTHQGIALETAIIAQSRRTEPLGLGCQRYF